MEQRGSSQSIELDIIRLTQQWESRRTIRNGDTPGQARRKGPRPALAAIPTNVAAGAASAVNPFSLTARRQKAAASRTCWNQQQQQPSVRFAVEEPPTSTQQQAAEPDGAVAAAANAATPATAAPATAGRAAGAAAAASAGGSGDSPSPYVLFRGRLSFAAEVDSGRKFDRPATAHKAAGATLKRKLLISPGADISAAFPTLRKPAAKQRRRSFSDVAAVWSGHAGDAAAEAAAADVAPSGAAAAATATDRGLGGGLQQYWSDPLPLPQSGEGAAAHPAAEAAAVAADTDMQDTAASPASSSGGSPLCGGGGMNACGGGFGSPPPPAFSPLPGALQHVLPTVDRPNCGFPSISARTMRDLLAHGAPAFGLTDFVVVDCRYEYEFEGGRLPGAVHLTTPDELQRFLQRRPGAYWQHTALIFHCEFSTERGPRAAKFVRNKDREAHLHDYPALCHPHVYVLQGGFKSFWKSFPEVCQGGYTPMDHPEYSDELKVCHNIVKKAWAKTTRTYTRKQKQRRPSYRLRQSTGAASGSGREGSSEAVADPVQSARLPPALVAAQHAMHF